MHGVWTKLGPSGACILAEWLCENTAVRQVAVVGLETPVCRLAADTGSRLCRNSLTWRSRPAAPASRAQLAAPGQPAAL